jgi:hypothetical protein
LTLGPQNEASCTERAELEMSGVVCHDKWP